MVADAAELMHAHVGAERGLIAYCDVPGERRAVGEHVAGSDYAIVRDVGLGHEQVVVADRGQRAAARGAAVHRHAFADDVTPSDHQTSLFASEFQVLRRLAHRGEGVDSRPLADLARAFDDDVPGYLNVVVNGDMIADDRIWADRDIRAESRA